MVTNTHLLVVIFLIKGTVAVVTSVKRGILKPIPYLKHASGTTEPKVYLRI